MGRYQVTGVKIIMIIIIKFTTFTDYTVFNVAYSKVILNVNYARIFCPFGTSESLVLKDCHVQGSRRALRLRICKPVCHLDAALNADDRLGWMLAAVVLLMLH
jgi:hypothetical protein